MNAFRNLFEVKHPHARLAIGLIGIVMFVCGLWWKSPGLLGGGAVVLCLVIRNIGFGKDQEASAGKQNHEQEQTAEAEDHPPQIVRPAPRHAVDSPIAKFASPTPTTTDDLVEEMLSEGRYALLLRPETNRHLRREQTIRAIRCLDEAMALVPSGNVHVGAAAEQALLADRLSNDRQRARHWKVQPVYLDRYAVTNEEFQKFVHAGGYEQLAYWAEEALPALFEFVDETGQPGPRFWSNGRFRRGSHRLPVVGICWYEASAYARWVGKRLPTDAEWTKAGAWPVESAPGRIVQRRFPWGESFDVRRANIWGSSRKKPVPVDDFSSGASVGGIHQLIGNVWEWTASALQDSVDDNVHVPETMRSIRGGAYNTYFENHATCHYVSGEFPLARKPNIGFRLALSMSVLGTQSDDEAQPAAKDTEEDVVQTAENNDTETVTATS